MKPYRTIDDIIQTLKMKMNLYFFKFEALTLIALPKSAFNKKQKDCMKRIYLVTDDVLYDRKSFIN